MQNYQVFWNEELAMEGYRQLVIEWDTFIRNFSKAIGQHAHYQLNSTQKDFIKTKIDPLQTNQIYKNAFLLFAQQYWDIPSNRTKLFKMKINLTHLPKLNFLTGSAPQTINISIRHINSHHQAMTQMYQLKQDTLYTLDEKGYEVSDKAVNEKGFLSIGSSQNNDISVQDCLYLNREHLKLVSRKLQKKMKKKNIFEEKDPQPQVITEWFIRDIAKSNRLRYLLDKPWKYVLVKPKMVISLSLSDSFEIRIDKIGFNSQGISCSKTEYQNLVNILNADRLNYMGQIDPSVPLKAVLDIDFTDITPKQIDDLYKEGHYYPDNIVQQASTSKGSKDIPTVTFTVINKRSLESKKFVTTQNIFTIGRSQQCTYKINDISIRKKEMVFQLINGFWTVRNAEQTKCNLQQNIPGIFLASYSQGQQSRHSNRLQLNQGYSYVLRGRLCEIEIDLKEPKQPEQQF